MKEKQDDIKQQEGKRDIFIGGAWPYANYLLHVGHLAALLPGDILAKYFRECGDNVVYVSGSDCHGTPITQRAIKEGKNPAEISEYYHENFQKTFDRMGFEFDEYSTTMSDYHKKYVEEQFKKLIENGYIYEKEEEQDFCEGCDKFLSDREIVGICPHCGGNSTGDQCEVCGDSLDSSEVLDKHCKDCGGETVLRTNKHLYFELTAFQDELQELIVNNRETWRNNALGEAQKYIDMGLVDRAATRQLNWGVDVPVKGYDDKKIYVWIEAVLGYLSTAKEVLERRGIDIDQFMSKDNPNLSTYYVHGKDNIPFHTTIYPALLMGIGNNYQLPQHILSSAYVNLNNSKMSKSKGNLITVNELLDIFDRDTLRLYFSLKGPEVNDMNCSIQDIAQTHNKFLVGMLGNFVNRNLAFIQKKFDGKITEGHVDEKIKEATEKTYQLMGQHLEKGELRAATTQLFAYVLGANKYYDSREPWKQVKENIEEFNDTTYTCTYMMANLSNLMAPIMPDGARKIREMLQLREPTWEQEEIQGDIQIQNFQMLYDRLDEKKYQDQLEVSEETVERKVKKNKHPKEKKEVNAEEKSKVLKKNTFTTPSNGFER